MDFDPKRDYPLGTQRPDLVSTPGGSATDGRHAGLAARGAHRRGRDSRDPGDAASAISGRARGRAGTARGKPRTRRRACRGPGRSPARRLHGAPPATSDRVPARGLGCAARVPRSRSNGGLRAGSGRRVRRARAPRRCVAAASSRARSAISTARRSSRRCPSWAWSPPTGRSIRRRSSSSKTASSSAWTGDPPPSST